MSDTIKCGECKQPVTMSLKDRTFRCGNKDCDQYQKVMGMVDLEGNYNFVGTITIGDFLNN